MQFSDIYSIHEVGRKKNQEDYLWPTPGSSNGNDNCFIVCDGVGGSDNGEVASKVVAEYIGNAMKQVKPDELTIQKVSDLLYTAQQELIRHANENKLNTDMATTFSMCAMAESRALLVWCGDSRIYHLRNGETLYKTQDHSLVGMLLRNGDITEDEAAVHPRKNVILRAIKADNSPINAEGYWIDDLNDEDFIMLCTDGLLENIREKDLYEILKPGSDPDQIIAEIKLKCDNKTRDNYSMYLLKINTRLSTKERPKTSLPFLYMLIALIAAIGVIIFVNAKGKVTIPKKVTNTDSMQTVKRAT
jgi:serine/threonine protein phosphatase PrpC